jgi:ribosomal protein S18 acetylase RimI-like enzyme
MTCLEELKKIADSCKKDIGFVTTRILEKAINEKRIIIQKKDERIIGFLHFYHRKRDQQTTIYELMILPEYQKMGYGKELINELVRQSLILNRTIIKLKCPVDNFSNGFYKHLGFELIQTVKGRKRELNIWIKKL